MAHYQQPDANNIESQANAYRAELVAGTHQTADDPWSGDDFLAGLRMVLVPVDDLQALRVEGNGYVQAAMNKIFEVSVRNDSLGSAFRKLTARSSSIIPVVEDERLIGIVTLQNLMHSMSLLAESRKLRRDESES